MFFNQNHKLRTDKMLSACNTRRIEWVCNTLNYSLALHKYSEGIAGSSEQEGAARRAAKAPPFVPSQVQNQRLSATYYKSGAWRTDNIRNTAADQQS
jgi:hypothetical protein